MDAGDVADSRKLSGLEKRIGYRFKDRSHLVEALIHPSFIQQYPDEQRSYQRLEFLGDAILSAILAEELFKVSPEKREGPLSKHRAALARGKHLAHMSRELGVQECLLFSDAEEQNQGRERESILEDALEALVGAIFLDSDYNRTRGIVLSWYGDVRVVLSKVSASQNPKGTLQELVQPDLGNDAVQYAVIEESGPDHQKRFIVAVVIAGRERGRGEGSSKKLAEEAAARVALKALKER